MTVLNLNNTKEFGLYQILYQIHANNDKIEYFRNKYSLDFDDFEQLVKNSQEEKFELWDDYIAWKANIKALDKLNSQKQDIESGNYTIS